MGRYSKSYSNYVLRKRHQTLKDGSTIFERDWGTLGERHVIEDGKRKVYADSGFLFTDTSLYGNKYRNNTGEWSEAYTQDTLGDTIDQTVNDTTILDESNDIRDYAYYGSAVELVRASIENIIKWFPGRFWSTNTFIGRYNSNEVWVYIKNIITDGHHNYAVEYTEDETQCGIYVIKNPFTIDFYDKGAIIGEYDNALRNMPLSFRQYTLNGYDIKTWDVWAKPYEDCDENYSVKYDIIITYGVENSLQTGHIYGVSANNTVIWCTTIRDMVVQPRQVTIDNYFTELKGFEAKLLSNTDIPKYTTKFITPIPYGNNRPEYIYVERAYTWPSDGYCISVDTIGFENYLTSLYNLATIMDELWCDNIWRNMTHEAITNFDWTYTKNYEEGQEEENILGGTRMEGILRIWGRCFDDIKRYVDGISLKNCVTYDSGSLNLGNAELSDKAELLGWEIYSTKLNKSDNLYLTNDFINNYIGKLNQNERWDCSESNNAECGAFVSYEKWFNSKNPEAVSQNMVDNDFMNRLLLSSGEIFRTKGTKQGIEMVFGLFGIGNHDENNPDFEIEEKYYTIFPKQRNNIFYYYKQIFLPEDISLYIEVYDSDNQPYEDLESYLNDHPATMHSPIHIYIAGLYYDLIQSDTLGDVCQSLITNKSAVLNYDDEFSGIPISDVYIDNVHYIAPYFSQDRIYDGNVQFETKGGWGKQINTGDDIDIVKTQEINYLETIPYLESLENVEALLSVNVFNVGNKKIFYVNDLSDLSKYTESIPTNISHFFKLINPSDPNNSLSSWRNIPYDGVIDDNYAIFSGLTEDDIKLAEYYDKLRFDNLGNNPHCGYASYDLGTEYLDYLKCPFKHAIDNYGFSDIGYDVIAKQLKFKVTEHIGNRIVNNIHIPRVEEPPYIPFEDGTIIKIGDWYYEKQYIEDFDDYEYIEKVAVSDIVVPSDNEIYYYIEYVLPSKILKIKNNIDNNNYKKYFNEIILKYLTQVIPSTTILILENFKPAEEVPSGDFYYYTNTDTHLPTIDECILFNEPPMLLDKIEDLTIIAVPEDVIVTLTYISDGITSTVSECGEQNCLRRLTDGIDELLGVLPPDYKILQYYVPNIETSYAEINLR